MQSLFLFLAAVLTLWWAVYEDCRDNRVLSAILVTLGLAGVCGSYFLWLYPR